MGNYFKNQLRLRDAVRTISDNSRYYQASESDREGLFGVVLSGIGRDSLRDIIYKSSYEDAQGVSFKMHNWGVVGMTLEEAVFLNYADGLGEEIFDYVRGRNPSLWFGFGYDERMGFSEMFKRHIGVHAVPEGYEADDAAIRRKDFDAHYGDAVRMIKKHAKEKYQRDPGWRNMYGVVDVDPDATVKEQFATTVADYMMRVIEGLPGMRQEQTAASSLTQPR